MIFTAFFKALSQINDPRFRRVLLTGIGLTLLLLIIVYAGFLGLIQWFFGDGITVPLIGEITWLNDLLSWGSLFLMVVLSAFLMVPVASTITSMFLEDVAQAVEDRHYPYLPQPARTPVWGAIRDSVNFMGVLIAANLFALILYAIFSPFALFIFWGMNGYLLGMEYFQITAARRLGRQGAKDLRKKHKLTLWMAGTLMAIPLTIPLINLLIPILGAATFTHIFHALERRT